MLKRKQGGCELGEGDIYESHNPHGKISESLQWDVNHPA